MSVPFGSWRPSGAHPEVGFGRELKVDGAGRAGHGALALREPRRKEPKKF